jgi:hypothetical protein
MGAHRQVVADSTASLGVVGAPAPTALKALMRRGYAYEALEKFSQALQDMKEVVRHDRSATEAGRACQRLERFVIQARRLDGGGDGGGGSSSAAAAAAAAAQAARAAKLESEKKKAAAAAAAAAAAKQKAAAQPKRIVVEEDSDDESSEEDDGGGSAAERAAALKDQGNEVSALTRSDMRPIDAQLLRSPCTRR